MLLSDRKWYLIARARKTTERVAHIKSCCQNLLLSSLLYREELAVKKILTAFNDLLNATYISVFRLMYSQIDDVFKNFYLFIHPLIYFKRLRQAKVLINISDKILNHLNIFSTKLNGYLIRYGYGNMHGLVICLID